MKARLFFFLIVIVFTLNSTFSQVENVPLTHPVYTFLKEMKVKGIIGYINEDMPNLSRFEIRKHLEAIDKRSNELSATEIKLLNRNKAEFYESLDTDTATYFFHPEKSFSSSLSEVFSNKVKYIYAYKEKEANIYFNLFGHLYYGQIFKPEVLWQLNLPMLILTNSFSSQTSQLLLTCGQFGVVLAEW